VTRQGFHVRLLAFWQATRPRSPAVAVALTPAIATAAPSKECTTAILNTRRPGVEQLQFNGTV